MSIKIQSSREFDKRFSFLVGSDATTEIHFSGLDAVQQYLGDAKYDEISSLIWIDVPVEYKERQYSLRLPAQLIWDELKESSACQYLCYVIVEKEYLGSEKVIGVDSEIDQPTKDYFSSNSFRLIREKIEQIERGLIEGYKREDGQREALRLEHRTVYQYAEASTKKHFQDLPEDFLQVECDYTKRLIDDLLFVSLSISAAQSESDILKKTLWTHNYNQFGLNGIEFTDNVSCTSVMDEACFKDYIMKDWLRHPKLDWACIDRTFFWLRRDYINQYVEYYNKSTSHKFMKCMFLCIAMVFCYSVFGVGFLIFSSVVVLSWAVRTRIKYIRLKERSNEINDIYDKLSENVSCLERFSQALKKKEKARFGFPDYIWKIVGKN